MLPLTTIPWRLIGGLAACLGLFLGGAFLMHQWASMKAANVALAAELAETRLSLQSEENLRRANEAAATALMATNRRLTRAAKETQDAVPTLVPRGDVLPGGYRVLHDAAARGVVPGPSGVPDAAPVDAQDAARTLADNYAACLAQDAAYQQLQQWLRTQQGVKP